MTPWLGAAAAIPAPVLLAALVLQTLSHAFSRGY